MSIVQKSFKRYLLKELGFSSNLKQLTPTFSIDNIAELIRQAKDNNTPYIILTGAGCSQSAGIPLAGKLVEEMNKKFSVQLSNLSKEDRNNYNKCMNALTHQERRQLLQNHITQASINWAHIGLASLMRAGFTQRVLTFNFDNILMRACGLIGLYPSIYDFTNADVNLQNLIIDPSIIYLHGQSYGFRQLNDENETKSHANNMTNFIAQTLNTSPVIVAGYSGYNDGFFEQIDKHYCGEQRLFWIGYEKEIPEHLQEFFKKYANHAHYIGGHDADDFFVSLMQNLNCLPDFFTNHAEHTINILDEVTDFPIPNTDGGINILSDLRQQMSKMGKEILSLTAILNNLMMEGKYGEVITTVEANKNQEPDNDEIQEDEVQYIYAWAQVNKANEDWIILKRDFENTDERSIHSLFKRFEEAEKVLANTYELYMVWGAFLSELASLTNRVETYESSIEKFLKASEINSLDFTAYFYWGTNLLMLADLKNDHSYNLKALDKFLIAESIDPKNVYNLACNYIRLGKMEEAKDKLIICKENGTLPPIETLVNDSDMKHFLGDPWFDNYILEAK